ncbi:MAG: ketoacyl-ACP synthase III [Lachnospiraceae bacterium]|uniref:Beta-ketoacyl-[acyl-carrier-protein] synthase III n=1 Tax=Candidatus Weimeria bifida TaxID=2599074 RepID=A0A6N7J150_9FIRM|nr:ketoacyl-ACP synthase III [Candidatus Weimeria bifida]RRF96538.1 MAG: ketoacyl-ACP synthase III [Lachnospiraceae bacterium]
MTGVKIISTGSALPSRVVTNDDLSKIEETSDEWIKKRTGIEKRHFTAEGESANSLAVESAGRALEKSGISKDEIGLVLTATLSGDYSTPSVASFMQSALGLSKDIPYIDINAACSGAAYAVEIARSYLVANQDKKKPYALVTGVEELSKLLDPADRTTNILFGDGAGSVVMTTKEGPYASTLGAESSLAINCPGAKNLRSYIRMDGKEVFRFAVKILPYCIKETVSKAGLSTDDIDYFVCHQANKRIIDHVVRAMKLPKEKFYCNVDHIGNTSGASIFILLDEMEQKGMLSPGDTALLSGFGSGLTWGSVLVTYK